MKIYGHIDDDSLIENLSPTKMAEITLVATPEELQKIAAFLLFSAQEMARMGHQFNHLHLSDEQPEFEGSPHFIVFNPDSQG
jgi:hypothetical protein